MNRRSRIEGVRLAGVLLLLVFPLAGAMKWPPTEAEKKILDQYIHKVVAATSQADFPTVFQTSKELRTAYPDYPHGLVLEVVGQALLQNYFRGNGNRDAFLSACTRAETELAGLVEKHPEDSMLRFFLGGVLGYRGMLEVAESRYVKALGTGLDAVKHLEKAVTGNEPMYDAYFGLALFYFARHTYGKILSWLPSNAKDQSRAYDALSLARSRGVYMQHEASFREYNFRLNDKRFENFETGLASLRSGYPRNPYIRALLLDYALKKERWELVAPVAKELRAIYAAQPATGRSAWFHMGVVEAWAEWKAGDRKAARAKALDLEDDIPNLEAWSGNAFWVRKLRDLLGEMERERRK